MTTLISALKSFIAENPEMLLSDGADTWLITDLVDHLNHSLYESDEAEEYLNQTVSIKIGENGINIYPIDDDGYIGSVALYNEILED